MAIVYSSFLFIGGVYYVGLSIFGHWQYRSINSQSEPVTLRVLSVAKDHESEEDTLYTPTFEIVEGKNQGAVLTGPTGSDGHHKVGETIGGLFDPKTGMPISDKDLSLMKWMPIWTALFGATLLGIWIYRLA